MSFGGFLKLRPRNGRMLMVLFICRVSRPAKGPSRKKNKRLGYQDERSNEDQARLLKRWLKRHYKGRARIRTIKGSGSGERLDRKEPRRARRAVRSRMFDLVLAEDLGRIFRRVDAYKFCEYCEDFETRVIAVNDHVDTGQEGWRMSAFFAAMKNEMYNADLAKRIVRGHDGHFETGGLLPCQIFGYVKPKDAEHEDEMTKDPAAEEVYREWFRILEEGGTYQDVADWLTKTGVPVGPYCRITYWTCQMVSRITHNKILKGERVRNKKKVKRVNRTGRRALVKAAPKEHKLRYCPHLAFFDAEYYDRVVAAVDARNAMYRRKPRDGRDPRENVPRKRTRFPGQAARCGICGRRFVYGGHGQVTHLICQGAREYRCWCSITIDGPLAAAKIAAAIAAELEELEEFDPAYEEKLNEEAKRVNDAADAKIKRLDAEIETKQREVEHVLTEIRSGNRSKLLREDLARLEDELEQLHTDRGEAERTRVKKVVLPSKDKLKQHYRDAFRDLTVESYEFARKLRLLVPRIVVFPYRLCDGGHLFLRAKFRLRLAALIPDVEARKAVQGLLEKILEVDLFNPPQREAFRKQVVALRKAGLTERAVAKQLGITQPAVQHAEALQRLMDRLGIVDPYLPVTEPPADYTKLRRHKHKGYRFEPLDGAGEL